MKFPVVAFLIAFASFANAEFQISCRGKGELPSEVFGYIDIDAKTFIYTEHEKVQVRPNIPDIDSALDERCGRITFVSSNDLNFEITGEHAWGQYILQIPEDRMKSEVVFPARLHACDYDGDWSSSYDEDLTCTGTQY